MILDKGAQILKGAWIEKSLAADNRTAWYLIIYRLSVNWALCDKLRYNK